MTLEERIENIKTLLKFCPKSTKDVMVVEDKVGLFFANLFNNDTRFEHSYYDRVYPRIYLSEELNVDYKTYSTTIGIEYTYDNDSDGEYRVSYSFNDPDLEDSWWYNELKRLKYIEYSEVPDEIWEIIQNTLYEEAIENINTCLESAKKSVIYYENKLSEFNNLKLNK